MDNLTKISLYKNKTSQAYQLIEKWKLVKDEEN